MHEFAEGRQIALKPFAYCRHNRTLADRDNPGRRERFEPCRCAPSKVVSLEQDNGILCVYVFRYTLCSKSAAAGFAGLDSSSGADDYYYFEAVEQAIFVLYYSVGIHGCIQRFEYCCS